MQATESFLQRVCKRIAAVEASLREHSTDLPLVAANVIRSCEFEGERCREVASRKTDARVRGDPFTMTPVATARFDFCFLVIEGDAPMAELPYTCERFMD